MPCTTGYGFNISQMVSPVFHNPRPTFRTRNFSCVFAPRYIFLIVLELRELAAKPFLR